MHLRPTITTRNAVAKTQLPDPPAGLARELSQAIERLGNPTGDVLDALDATVLLRLLQRVRSRDRIGMLQTLRVPSARLSPRAAEQCLTTLRKRNPEIQQRAAGTISHPTLTALVGVVDDYERHGDDHKLDAAVAAFSESRPELMLAALSSPLFGPGYTALLRHALQRFPMPAWPKDDVQNVIEACSALEGAWRPLLPHAHDAPGTETVEGTGPAAGPWSEGRTPEPADWDRRAENLDALLASARSAAHRVTTHLAEERAPAHDDIDTLTALRTAALALHEDLRTRASVLPSPDPADVRALSTAANTVAVEQSERARHRVAMLRVAQLQGPPGSTPLEAVREQAIRLLDAPVDETEHLRLLVELADANASDDDATVDDLHALLKEASQDISSVATLILRGKVTASASPSGDTPEPMASAPAPQTAPPPATLAPDPDTVGAADRPAVTVTAPQAEVVAPTSVPAPTATVPPMPGTVADSEERAVPAPPATQLDPAEPAPLFTELIRRLISSGELALAGHAARASGRSPLQQALATLHLSHCVRSETGPCASAVRERIEGESGHPSGTGQDERMLLLAAALRAALLTADPNAGELVNALSDTCAGMTHFQQLCRAVGTASARGQLTAVGGLNVLESVTEADAEVSRASEDARLHLAAPRSLHFPRAEKIVREWWKPDGLIGSLVVAAADDRRDRADQVAAQMRKLTQPALGKELKSIDYEFRKEIKGAVLQGAARRRILEYATESLDIVNTWLLATRAVARGPVLNSVLTNLRRDVRAQTEDAYTELRAHADMASQPLSATITETVLDSVRTTIRLLDGATLPGTEPAPDQALHADLLRCPELPLTRTLKPSRAVTLDDIERAWTRSWAEAARGQAMAGNFAAARVAVEAVEGESDEDDNSLRDDIEQARGRALTAARAAIDQVRGDVATATRQGRLPEPGRSDITTRVEAAEADLAGDDFSGVHRQLDEIVKSMPELADRATADLMQRARGEINNNRVGVVPDDVMTKITQLVGAGDLATAEDYLLTALTGEHPPTSAPENDLEHFFPSGPDSLTEGITPELVEAVGTGGTYSGLAFSQLRTRERNTTAETLRSWAQLLRNWRTQKNNNHSLRGALRIAGIEYGGERSVGSYAPNRKWFELTDVQLLGGCRLPAFGSEAGGRLRVLLTPDVSDVTTLTAWVDQDTSTLPVLVVVLGTLSATARRELALQTAKQPMRPLLCLDAAALAYLASKASNRFTTTERVLAPFAATNPYRPDANESVPSEMFYGRQQELNDITSTTGAQLLYGGRQLGKSALLRAAARRFETTPGHVALYIPLPTTLGLGQKTDELWDMISRELDRKDIAPSQQARRGTAQQRVTAAITSWLDDDSTRRLLVLFDECDIFFDAEAQENFPQTTRLRELMSTTDRRFKPVFAGLHQVQRFSGLPNQPLYDAHFGKPVVIGPLAPAPAFRLVRQPLEALGIRIPDELVHRVLAYCNYHPKLLQLVGQALVRASLDTRVATPPAPGTPPWHIDNAVLERVIGSQDLTDRTRNTINLTLELDPRYKLIALVVALEAHLDGVDRRITTRVLSKACDDWWPEGFIGQGPDEFRALLEEMTGLGILASDPQGWRLRSSNVLRLLGNQSAIEEALESHDTSKPLTKLTAAQARRPIAVVAHDAAPGRVSPLTEQQLARLTNPGNELRIVIGSAATSLDAVFAVLEDQQRRAPSKLDTIVSSSSPSHYKELLRTGKPGPLHRIVVWKLSHYNDVEKIRVRLRQVATIQPPRGVTRTVVVLADACNQQHRDLAVEFDPDNVLIPLRRVTPEGISSWATEVEALVPFTQTEARNRLMDATGGWPMLLDVALTQACQGRPVLTICKNIRKEVESGALGTEFLDGLGLATCPDMHALLTVLVALNEPLPWDDLVEFLQDDHPEPRKALEELRMLDVLVQDEKQLYLLEPTVHRAWPPRPHG